MIDVVFELERDTKRTRRFAEVEATIHGEDTDAPVVGTLYVQQWALKKLNEGELPEKVHITIEVG